MAFLSKYEGKLGFKIQMHHLLKFLISGKVSGRYEFLDWIQKQSFDSKCDILMENTRGPGYGRRRGAGMREWILSSGKGGVHNFMRIYESSIHEVFMWMYLDVCL
ncbi:hypothetical protein ACJX0J_030979 [Zea mays]